MKKVVFASVLLAFVSIFVACKESGESGKISYKNEVCVADMSIFAGTEPKCEEGQIFSFQPNRWGNQQLPILVTSYFCDFNAPIVQNESGVACVYKRRYNAQTQDNNATK